MQSQIEKTGSVKEKTGASVTENIKVICHAGYRAEEYPVVFFLGGRKIEVEEIVDRWIGKDHRYFKVKGNDGARYILRHNGKTDTWQLTLFDRTLV